MTIASNTNESPEQIRCAIYTRYSSDMQRPASLEDQERGCREAAAGFPNWVIAEDYVRSDAGISGTSLFGRDGINSLLEDAKKRIRPYDYLLVDDTSRLARDLGDVLQLTKKFTFHGVHLYFASQKLDSRDESNFRMQLTLYGLIDEQHIRRLAKNVHRGLKGRVLEGFSSGSRCFGYKSVRVPDPSRDGEHGSCATLGTRLEIIESQAITIRRIYEMFANGTSVHQLVKILNEEKVPAARRPKIGSLPTSWNSSLVNRILRNPKYAGTNVWNKTKQYKDPDTNKIDIRLKSASEVVYVTVPHLRIVSLELIARVEERFLIVNEKLKPHRLGGMNRAKNKSYLFSGMLECGVCGSRMIITGGKGAEASYGCTVNRYSRGCSNNLRIRADRFAAQFVQALATRLLRPDILEHLISRVSDELNAHLEKTLKLDLNDSNGDLQSRRALQQQKVSKLAEAIADPALFETTSLYPLFVTAEAELKHINQQIDVMRARKKTRITIDEVRALVMANVDNLLAVCSADVVKARQVFQRHIERLILVPTETPAGPVYEVMGDVNLFAPSTPQESDVVLDHSSTQMIQHYTQFMFIFVGIPIDPRIEGENETPAVNARCLIALLSDVLRDKPQLEGELLRACKWEVELQSVIEEHDHETKRVFDARYISWILMTYEEKFTHSLGMLTIKNSHTGTKAFSFTLSSNARLLAPVRIPPSSSNNANADAPAAA